MLGSRYSLACSVITCLAGASFSAAFAPVPNSIVRERLFKLNEAKNENVLQTEDTKRDKVMTFSYDMSLEPKYEKPTYPGTGNGLSGDAGEYDVVVIGSGMGGLACGALSAKYGDKVLVLESHIKCGGSAHTFSRMHNGGKYSFEVGPSIFEGLDRPSLNPLRMIFDILEEEMPVETYTGLGYWTPQGYWRFPIGSKKNFEDLLLERADDGPKAVAVSMHFIINSIELSSSTYCFQFCDFIRNGMHYVTVLRHWVEALLQFLFLTFVKTLGSLQLLQGLFLSFLHTQTYS